MWHAVQIAICTLRFGANIAVAVLLLLSTVALSASTPTQAGGLDASFMAAGAPDGEVRVVRVDATGRIVVGGSFSNIAGIPRPRLARLLSDGSVDTSFSWTPRLTSNFIGNFGVNDVHLESGGGGIVAGEFEFWVNQDQNALSTDGFARINASGTIQPWAASPVNCCPGDIQRGRRVRAAGGGKFLLGGNWMGFNAPNNLARVHSTGAYDSSFAIGTGPHGYFSRGDVRSIGVQSDGRVLVAGSFNFFNNSPCPSFIRINPNGTRDGSFSPPPVSSFEQLSDGTFITFGGTLRRYTSIGDPMSSFAPVTLTGTAAAAALQPDGSLVIGGDFSAVNGVSRNRLARVLQNGAVDLGFDPRGGPSGAVAAIAVQADGRIIVGGAFAQYDGVSAANLVRVMGVGSSYDCYVDNDSDGYGFGQAQSSSGPCGVGFAFVGGDCDDQDALIHPAAAEVCDGVDNDCDGAVDEGLLLLFYVDSDGDGYGNPNGPAWLCGPTLGYSGNADDCNDACVTCHPGAMEICDCLDNNCDSIIDEGFVLTYCTPGTTSNGCTAQIAGAGSPGSLFASGFHISISGVPGQRYGLVLYGLAPANAVWAINSTSYVCVAPPQQRTVVQESGGSSGLCDGAFVVDFNAYIATHPASIGSPFQAGDTVYAQAWFRDPGAPKQTNLSNGLRFTLCN